jgi:hypothetical protein
MRGMTRKFGVTNLLLVVACSQAQMSKTVESAALAVHQDFAEVHKLTDQLVSNIADVYTHLDRYDLSVDHMDVDQGGHFTTFKNNAYYVSNNSEGAAYYSSPRRPVDDGLRRELKILTHLEPFIDATWKQLPAAKFVFFGISKPETLAIFRPFFDVPSFFPPGLQLSTFEWIARGEQSPEKAKWSNRPFTDLTGEWVMDIARGVAANGTIKGVVVLSISMVKLGRKHLAKQTGMLWLLGADLSVIGASPTAKGEFQLPMLEDSDLLNQLHDNKLAADQFKLNGTSKEPGVRKLAARISNGATNFRETVKGKSYRFVVKAVPEVGFYVLGASP